MASPSTDNNPYGESDTSPQRHLRWGVATHLLMAFCGVTLMTVLVAVVGDSGLRDARRTLQTSRDSFDRVSTLLAGSIQSLESAGATIDNAGTALDLTVATMEETSERVTNLNAVDLPAVIAIGEIREALTAVAVGERTLLMRQLYDPQIRQQQRDYIDGAFLRAEAAIERISKLESSFSEDKRRAWLEFIVSWGEWDELHDRLMSEFDQIDDLLEARVRGGFEFEDIAKRAFDIAFGEGQTARERVNSNLDAVVSLISHSTQESASVASLNTQNATSDAVAAKDSMANATRQIGDFKGQMANVAAQVAETTDRTKASLENAASVRWYFIICTVLGFAVSILLALWQTRFLSRPIRHAAEQMDVLARGIIDEDIMQEYVGRSDEIGTLARSVGEMLRSQREEVKIAGDMAQGDFSGSVTLRSGEDQLGRALSAMMRITHDALVRVNRHVRQVTAGAEAISTASQSLSDGSSRTASALVEISVGTTRLGEQTHANARHAAQANEFAKASRAVAENGYAAIEEMVASMTEIQTSSAHIARIVKLIDDIAFQTNLLALNAAVEAARAGRQGKGFSVVAEEVRNLASRSAKAARETATLVEDTVKRVDNGVAIALRADEAFKQILDNAQQTTDLYGEIAAASQEQSRNIDQIVTGLSEIDHSTQANSRYALETAAAAANLSRQSGELRNMMVRFQLQDAPNDHNRERIMLDMESPQTEDDDGFFGRRLDYTP